MFNICYSLCQETTCCLGRGCSQLSNRSFPRRSVRLPRCCQGWGDKNKGSGVASPGVMKGGGCVGVLQGAPPPITVVSLKDQDLVLKQAPGASCRREHLTLGFPEKQVANAQLPVGGLALTGFRVLIQLLVRGKDLYSSSVVLCFLSSSCQTPAHHFLQTSS